MHDKLIIKSRCMAIRMQRQVGDYGLDVWFGGGGSGRAAKVRSNSTGNGSKAD